MPKPTNMNAHWAPFARTILRRLRTAEADNRYDLDLATEGDRIDPAERPTKQIAIALFDDLEHSQRHDSRDLDTMRASGVDGWTLDETGADTPERFIEPGKLMTALQLAATFGAEPAFLDALQCRKITVIDGIDPQQLAGTTTSIGRLLLPEGWSAHMRAPRAARSGILQLLRPVDPSSRMVPEQAYTKLETEILAALALPHPLMILLPAGARLPARLRRVLPAPIRFASLDREILLALLAQTHSATNKIDRVHIRPLLPSDETLANLDMLSLFAALRQPNAAAVARALAKFQAPDDIGSGDMTLAQIGGDTAAHRAATDLVADLAAWRRGEAEWGEINTSLLLHGEPGSGKSVIARAIAASAGVPLVEGSFGTWQSAGHLGDMLREMRRTFAAAAAKRPAVLFIDEVDAAGSRDSHDTHSANYRRQVINQFLQEIDALRRSEGVLLIGATNHRDALDPAIVRPGRFDLHHSLGRPTQAQVLHMLRRFLPDVTEPDLAMLARTFSGELPAMIDATIRAAKAQARRLGQPLSIPTLIAARPVAPEGYDRRIAIHECGHAIVATLLRAGPVRRMQLSRDGGSTSRGSAIHEGTPLEFEHELTIIMAGRAAERLALGSITAGAGGSVESDLAQASALQLQLDREFGLGINGNAWIGPPDMKQLSSEDCTRLRVKLDQFERRARALLAPHRDLLETLAAHLVEHRELQEANLRPWLSGLQPVDLAEAALNGGPTE
ncbi:AAA family ATPase [Salipiger manganoxidans]|uniref:AAA family ATPase n=1 Tax=Salipiger marinus TaxID=555512 RepID=UPI001E57336A|nr:AAA family ATPase [Salipiger manganoxidans]MCD1620947.1 AAA family ATPase [Salipiger manganoxidans]